jgi:hypothetical protein
MANANSFFVGCHMNRSNTLLSVLLLAVLSASACSGPKPGTVCLACSAGEGTIALTMVADTLPANPSLLTFQITITSITFTPATGTPTTVNLSPALTVDLMRLQSDTVFLGTFAKIPAAQYTSVTLTISSGSITFLNDTNTTLSGCQASFICPLTIAAGNPVATFSYTVSQNAVTGIGIDLNYLNTVTISGSTLAANFSNANVLSAFTLPRAGSNLAAGQLDLIEDFTGVVSLGNPAVTVTSASVTGRGALTANATTNTNLDADPTGTLCTSPTQGSVSSCVSSNEAASMDVVLNSDGTLSVQEIEPLLATLKDTVEGIVVSINSNTQFVLIVTDLIPAAQNSLIGTLSIGTGFTVNIPNPNPFLVDTKGLLVQNNFGGNFSSFHGQTNTTAMHFGQTVAVHVIAPFTAASGTTLASATSDTVTLRWSRFTATTSVNSSPAFSITGFPSYFNASNAAQAQTFLGTQGADGITSLDGVPTTTSLIVSKPVAMRALFIENSGDTLVPAFFAAKVRQH